VERVLGKDARDEAVRDVGAADLAAVDDEARSEASRGLAEVEA